MRADANIAGNEAPVETLLRVENLSTQFASEEGLVRAVEGVSLEVRAGEMVGIVGESGCGKSVTGLSIMRLIPSPPGRIVSGRILFKGRDLFGLSEKEMEKVRGNDISMVFQEPMTSLNPVFTVGDQIMEALHYHQGLDGRQARQKAIEMLGRVKIPSPDTRVDAYPHQLSGGMRQRVMIAMALACRPELLIADEPTTALDVTIQAQVLDLLDDLRRELGMAVILITHDLGVVSEMADRVVVMYAGRVVEEGTTATILREMRHPYTRGLLDSIPDMEKRGRRLHTIPGQVPDAVRLPEGCKFHPRCPFVIDACRQEEPPLLTVTPDHRSRCIRWQECC